MQGRKVLFEMDMLLFDKVMSLFEWGTRVPVIPFVSLDSGNFPGLGSGSRSRRPTAGTQWVCFSGGRLSDGRSLSRSFGTRESSNEHFCSSKENGQTYAEEQPTIICFCVCMLFQMFVFKWVPDYACFEIVFNMFCLRTLADASASLVWVNGEFESMVSLEKN